MADMNIVLLPTNKLVPNEWNPNVMTDEEFAELVAEVRRTGRLAKPIVARSHGPDTYQVIDGAHALRAAIELGFETVPCEIIEASDFEAMLQTYKRNQHGKHDRILEAKLFRSLQKMANVSGRKFADQYDIHESTLRNSLIYLDAVEMREKYVEKIRRTGAPIRPAEDSIRPLPIRQVRTYLQLPDVVRDYWLDAGADLRAVAPYREDDEFPQLQRLAATILCHGLSLEPKRFKASLRCCLQLLDLYFAHPEITDLDEYLLEIAVNNFPPEVAEELPIDPRTARVVIPLDAWEKILLCMDLTLFRHVDVICDQVKQRVDEALDRAGIDKSLVVSPQLLQQLHTVAQGPDFIRDANYLTLEEKVELIKYSPGYPADAVLEAKRETCEELRRRRLEGKGVLYGQAKTVCRTILEDRHGRLPLAELQRLMQRPQEAAEVLFKLIRFDHWNRIVDGRPAEKVLRERLERLEVPELVLFAAALGGASSETMSSAWLLAVGGKTVDSQPPRIDGGAHATPMTHRSIY